MFLQFSFPFQKGPLCRDSLTARGRMSWYILRLGQIFKWNECGEKMWKVQSLARPGLPSCHALWRKHPEGFVGSLHRWGAAPRHRVKSDRRKEPLMKLCGLAVCRIVELQILKSSFWFLRKKPNPLCAAFAIGTLRWTLSGLNTLNTPDLTPCYFFLLHLLRHRALYSGSTALSSQWSKVPKAGCPKFG